jgi:hypothetical protein
MLQFIKTASSPRPALKRSKGSARTSGSRAKYPSGGRIRTTQKSCSPFGSGHWRKEADFSLKAKHANAAKSTSDLLTEGIGLTWMSSICIFFFCLWLERRKKGKERARLGAQVPRLTALTQKRASFSLSPSPSFSFTQDFY